MLETTPIETTKSFALIAFEPRQVTLVKQREMKIKKIQSETLENETSDQMVTLNSNHKEKTKKKKKKTSSRDSAPLLLSIAAYLEHNGFVKTLTAFRSEALIDELDGSNEHSLDLEMYYKYLEASKYGAEPNLNGSLELDSQKEGTIKKIVEESKCDASVKSISKKKRKKDKGSDADTVTKQHVVSNGFSKCATDSDEKLTDEVVPTLVVKSKEKKKKNKVVSDSLDESAKTDGSETFKVPAENTVCELQLDESDKKLKDKKKKKSKLISVESVVQGDPEALPQAIKEKTIDLEYSQSVVSIERKGSKKRKSLASEENESQTDGKIESEEVKRHDIEGSVEGKGKNHPLKANPLQESDGHASKKRKTENGQVDSNKKQRNGSAEPKTVNAFQRVKIDEVEFVDERLQDNSYWAKDGADIGYGAKAQEVLGQVRGRDFRHEKTKKKRGSYRGGQIDLQSHSIKFDNSDDE